MRRKLILLVVVLLLVFGARAAAAQDCPLIGYSAGAGSFYVEETSSSASGNIGSFHYDLVGGTFSGGHQGSGEGGAFARLGLPDHYTIVGLPSTVPVTFRARVRFVGVAGADVVDLPFHGPVCLGSSGLFMLMSETLLDEVEVRAPEEGSCDPRSFDTTLELELTKLPGEEFPLRVVTHLSAGHQIQITVEGTITFVDLPSGATIRSCHGYAGVPVAASLRSWGELKASYR